VGFYVSRGFLWRRGYCGRRVLCLVLLRPLRRFDRRGALAVGERTGFSVFGLS